MNSLNNTNVPIGLDEAVLKQLTENLSEQQLIWLSGYFYGTSRTKSGLAEIPVSEALPEEPLTILYGSQTGNSKKAALLIAEKFRDQGLVVNAVDSNEYPIRNLKNEKMLLVIVSTHGEGDPPPAVEEFYTFLHSKRAPRLEGLRFSVLALGDKSYLHFCKTGKEIDQQLEKLGATRITPRLDCDVSWHECAEIWSDILLKQLQKPASQNTAVPATVVIKSTTAPVFNKKNPLEATILEKIQLNGRGSSKETWHLELSLEDSGLTYEPGDSLAVYAANSERIVAEVLKAGRLNPAVFIPSHESNFGDLLLHHFELTVLTRDLLEKYAAVTSTGKLKNILSDDKAIQEYIYGRDLADLLTDFPADISPAALADILRKAPARAYSIASSLTTHPNEAHLTVAAVRYEAFGRQKEGLASTFLADRLHIGDSVQVYVEKNDYFKLPADTATDIIMVGAGTGIAPYRAFVGERVESNATGKNWLFFGNPNFTTDFLYQLEWQQYLKQGALKHLDVAFSRDQKEKIYVQHRLLQKSKQVFDWLENGANFYVCGDKNKMAKDVENTLVQIAAREGNFSTEKAVEYVKNLKKQRRYLEDVY